MYPVKCISKIEELSECPIFPIDQYQWTKEYRPKAFGQMALLNDAEIIIKMTALESNPLRRYTEDEDPVYKDSAMEAFLNFNPTLKNDYFNFEINANGAMLSGFGENRKRQRVWQLTPYRASCEAKIYEESWEVLLRVPMNLIKEMYEKNSLQKGDIITCNFFKISEDPSIEHYASYAPIDSSTPNFHLYEFFHSAMIE